MKRRLSRDQEKELADHARLMRAWKAWHQEQLDEALAGAHGAMIAELDDAARPARAELPPLRCSPACSAPTGAPSATTARLTVLHQINQSIMRLRERNGLPAIDDPSAAINPTTYFGASDTCCCAPRRPERIPVRIG